MRAIIICFVLSSILLGFNIEKAYTRARDLSKFEAAKAFFIKGCFYYNEMQYLAAVEFFRKAISEYPEYYTAREYLARSYKLSGFLDEALKEWEILANRVSNNVSIMDKINTLRSREILETFTIDSLEFVFSDQYIPTKLGRFRFPKPVDIAIDSEKNIYVTSFSSGKLVKLDSNGEGVSIFNLGLGSRFFGVDCLGDRICVSDFRGDSVYILDTDFRIIRSFGSTGKRDGNFHGPEGLSFDRDGNIYVVDSGNHRVQKFDKDGNFIFKFGEFGEYDEQFKNPSNLLVYEGTIYVTDTSNKRLVCFDEYGNFIKNIPIIGLESPRGINIYEKNIIVSDERKGLMFYGMDDYKITWFNSWDNNNRGFSRLVSAEADRDGILYCLDYNFESIFVFSPLQSRYTNLEIDITSVDISKYPLVAFYLNVRNRYGRPVYALKRNDFKIVEDSANVFGLYVDYLKNIDRSVSLALCVDRSYKTQGYHNEIPWVSDFILKKMRKNDSIRVLNFNKDTWVGNDFDWSRRRTIKALRERKYANGKCIGKVLYTAISDLLQKLNRRGIILISDGSINKSSFQRYTPENVIEYAKSHYIPIYVIVFKGKDPVLKRIADETGGMILKANELDGLRSIYDQIKDSEEYRYVVVYSTLKTPSVKGWWSDVKIEIDYKGQRGVEWGGYFVP